MYSIRELSMNFMTLDAEHQEQMFQELRTNINLYQRIAPELPLVKYVATGDVPVDQHGPIINAYKAWLEKQST
jgi:hypothetical protein